MNRRAEQESIRMLSARLCDQSVRRVDIAAEVIASYGWSRTTTVQVVIRVESEQHIAVDISRAEQMLAVESVERSVDGFVTLQSSQAENDPAQRACQHSR